MKTSSRTLLSWWRRLLGRISSETGLAIRDGSAHYSRQPDRALSIRQPWAWLIVHGYKDIENRSWTTQFRGPFYIHAATKFDREGYQWIEKRFNIPLPMPGELERGGIVGLATLVDCVDKHKSRWFTGPNGFVLANARPVPFIPLKGRLGFFRVNL